MYKAKLNFLHKQKMFNKDEVLNLSKKEIKSLLEQNIIYKFEEPKPEPIEIPIVEVEPEKVIEGKLKRFFNFVRRRNV